MRVAASILALLVALFGALPTAAVARSAPKVVLIVGPAGEATASYREQAERAARVAERYTPNVVRLYSPNATWPAVKEALDGAAVVVYLGHGNGWPSRYRNELYGATQNGFGLNPVAGGGDDAHQYFGEDLIRAHVRLADNAIVLLHHLCYASGNTEPGLPEGTINEARQRVVNYAAGFISAGAGAVVAEGHMGPAWYMKRVLTGDASIEATWRRSPNARGNDFRFANPRSAGYTVAMDPDHDDRGFYRSIVYRDGVGAGQLASSPDLRLPIQPVEPSLVGSGLTIGTPYLKAPPVAGATARLWFPFETRDGTALDGLTIGVRWDPIDVAAGSAAEEGAEPAATGSDEPASTDSSAPTAPSVPSIPSAPTTSSVPAATAPAPAPTADPASEPLTFIQPEVLGDVVDPEAAIVGPTRIVAEVTLPAQPGRYRLIATLHDKGKVAYDAATQRLLAGLIVDVGGHLGARYLVAPSLTVAAGRTVELPVGVANVGEAAWGYAGPKAPSRRNLDEQPVHATLVAHWVAVDGGVAPADASLDLTAGLPAGALDRADLGLQAPDRAGTYLLLLDVVVPGTGSLAAQGVEPALIRITVR